MATRKKQSRERSAAATEALERLRALMRALDHVENTVTFGNPTFKVKKRAFAVIDRYKGVDCLWLRIDPMERAGLLKQDGWFPSPYDPHKQALCVALPAIDWRKIRTLLRMSYWLAKN